MKPFWVTFYSYKGGVGRSMALANLATLLARRSRNVFMIDFDLEAPGLDSFREFGVESGHAGVVEYAHEFQSTNIAPDLEAFVQQCKFAKHVPGRVWLMPSGRKDEAYNSKRIGLNWEGLYESGLGQPFVENWKAAVFRKYRPDYVFVDSRTGLTDIGGICTLHLPDLVTLMFGLNDQNLHGIEAVLRIIRDAKSGNTPQVLPVATPVPNLPNDETGPFSQRIKEAESLLGLKIERTMSYYPLAALVEKLFTLTEEARTTRIGMEYDFLLGELQKRDRNGLDSLILQAQEACENDDEKSADRLKEVLLADFKDRADSIFNVGQIERRFRGRSEAFPFWKTAFDLDPSHAGAFKALSAFHEQQGTQEDLLSLHDIRLHHAEHHGLEGLEDLRREKGEALMRLGRYNEAAAVYDEAVSGGAKGRAMPRLVLYFNRCEAKRRALAKIEKDCWSNVVHIFEEDISVENFPPDTQANMLQAMHVAYACLGKLEKASELLDKADRCAQSAGKVGKIFSVKTYSYVSIEEFRVSIAQMVAALKSGKLWDGMAIPAAGHQLAF